MQDLISIKMPARTLRSSSATQLCHVSVNTVTYGHRAFAYAAPDLRNHLPHHIKNASYLEQSKKLLKTHLFEKSFVQFVVFIMFKLCWVSVT